jgi:DNA-binding MarR family transcriptional regulator
VVELTPAGRDVADRVRTAVDGLERRALGSLPAAQRSAFVMALGALTSEET